MSAERYRTKPWESTQMPPGIPFIISNEVAERFSFYGMKTILTIFMAKYLWLMGEQAGTPMTDAAASARYHWFSGLVYFTPLLGAILADFLFGKYRIIIWLSLVYCLGHGALALMGYIGKPEAWLIAGLWLIIFGSGGIKPCVSAHVGDQFGPQNQHLLTKVFNWFYFAINLGAFASSLMTPWLLEWYGPHWAFGIPGVLMLIATICFWAGRHKFIHVPANTKQLVQDLFSREGIVVVLKLCLIYLFVAVFWALFDQTGSSWVLQAEDMNRKFLGVTWLSSQIQALNPILILIFIPLFTYLIYPAIDKVFKLTPLRKISIGLFVMVIAFAIVAVAQQRIDAGGQPSISWQLLAYVILTASEIMVSIVCLEFSYTQAPRSMKSIIMALFLVSVSFGNYFTAGVNHFIELDAPAKVQWQDQTEQSITFAGHDGKIGTTDDLIADQQNGISFSGKAELVALAAQVSEAIVANDYRAINLQSGNQIAAQVNDPWGNPYRYTLVNSKRCRLVSLGADQQPLSQWDQGVTLDIDKPEPSSTPGPVAKLIAKIRPDTPWIEKRKQQLGIKTEAEKDAEGPSISTTYFVGGLNKLQGAAYFWFFTWLMLAAAVLFMIVAIFYKPKEYLAD